MLICGILDINTIPLSFTPTRKITSSEFLAFCSYRRTFDIWLLKEESHISQSIKRYGRTNNFFLSKKLSVCVRRIKKMGNLRRIAIRHEPLDIWTFRT